MRGKLVFMGIDKNRLKRRLGKCKMLRKFIVLILIVFVKRFVERMVLVIGYEG